MKLPWVSRERLEEAQAQIAKLEAEREHLLERLVPALREDAPAIPEALATLDKTALMQPIPGKPRLQYVINEANVMARKRAAAGGTILTELKEAAFKGRKDAKVG